MATAESPGRRAEPGFLSCRAMWTRRSRGAAKEGRDGRRSATSTERVGNGIQSGRQRDMPAADEGPGPAALPEPCYRRSMTAGRSGRGRDRRGRPLSNLRSAGAEQSRRSHKRGQIAHVPPASRSQQSTTMEAIHPRPRQCGPQLAMCCVLEPTTQMHTLATNQSLKAYQRVTVPRGQSVRRDDTAPEGAAEEKTAPSGASAAAMSEDGVSFREKLDRETHRSRNLK